MVGFHRTRPKPNHYLLGLSRDHPHLSDLVAPLFLIFLVNANNVNPEDAVSVFIAEVSERFVQVAYHGHITSIKDDGVFSLLNTPRVRQGLVGNPVHFVHKRLEQLALDAIGGGTLTKSGKANSVGCQVETLLLKR